MMSMFERSPWLLLLCLAACGNNGSGEGPASGGDSPDSGSDGSGEAAQSAGDDFPAPVADDCITTVEPGDHRYSCEGVDFDVVVDPTCLEHACGVIVDVHGMTMSGQQMRLNTELDVLAASAGYIVVHPNAPTQTPLASWNSADYPAVRNFIDHVLDVFNADASRVHVTGFSQGGVMSWWFICNHPDLIASAAPAAAFGGCDGAVPELPILYMNGKQDPGQDVTAAESMMRDIAQAHGLEGPTIVDGEAEIWQQLRWGAAPGTEVGFLWHDLSVATPAGGHCIPGGIDEEGSGALAPFNRTTCDGDSALHWGRTALEWFIAHPAR